MITRGFWHNTGVVFSQSKDFLKTKVNFLVVVSPSQEKTKQKLYTLNIFKSSYFLALTLVHICCCQKECKIPHLLASLEPITWQAYGVSNNNYGVFSVIACSNLFHMSHVHNVHFFTVPENHRNHEAPQEENGQLSALRCHPWPFLALPHLAAEGFLFGRSPTLRSI